MTASAGLRSAQASTHRPAAMIRNGNMPRTIRSPGKSLAQPALPERAEQRQRRQHRASDEQHPVTT